MRQIVDDFLDYVNIFFLYIDNPTKKNNDYFVQ